MIIPPFDGYFDGKLDTGEVYKAVKFISVFGDNSVTSNDIRIFYAQPKIEAINVEVLRSNSTDENEDVSYRISVQGSNFCGSLARCGYVVLDSIPVLQREIFGYSH